MAAATTQDMGKVDGAIKIHGILAMLEEIGEIKVMGTKEAGTSPIAILVVDTNKVMVVAQCDQTTILLDLSLIITQVSILIKMDQF